MRNLTVLIAATVVAAILVEGSCGGLGATALGEPHPRTRPPPPDTIVSVTGTARDGFGIRHYDGSEEFPPTTSEAMAECSEYDARIDQVRCRTQVRTWYRDLADLRQALAWAHRR